MVRLVLFDIDGTLIRTGGAGVRAFERTAATEFLASDGVQHMKFAGRTDRSLVREFFRLHQIAPTPANFDRFFARYVFLLDEQLGASHGGPCVNVGSFLEGLRALSPPPALGLLTGNVRLGAEIKLRWANLWDQFVTGAFGDDHEDRNQLAAIAHERGGRFLEEPLDGGELLVVGDTPFDIECGRAIGARVLALGTGGATMEQLARHQPDWLAADLGQVAPATVCA